MQSSRNLKYGAYEYIHRKSNQRHIPMNIFVYGSLTDVEIKGRNLGTYLSMGAMQNPGHL